MTLDFRRFLQERIGKTPLEQLNSLKSDRAKLCAKLEWRNPWGSVKDRIAYSMITKAEERLELLPDENIIVEPTSGNTGIALAGIGRALGYKVKIIIPERASEASKEIITELGGEVLETADQLCPRVGPGTDQCISLARALVASNSLRGRNERKYFMPNQYENFDNFLAHYQTTGPEIWRQTGGELTHFVCGIGTGGTVTGVGQYLKEREPDVRIVAVQPQRCHHIHGLRNLEESATPLVLKARQHLVDRWITVSDEEAFKAVRGLAFNEQLYVGPSSGAVLAASMRMMKEEDGYYVLIFGDSGMKYHHMYVSLGVFTEEEIERVSRQARHLDSTDAGVLAAHNLTDQMNQRKPLARTGGRGNRDRW
ncbi:cysteine synthase family protein [Candidatus Bathyarchaeota archaeon]|nr:cysteine synthase family protein [Candidatus Bathyarchaeota archaeon]